MMAVNGFHDTVKAVATVIYTNSLKNAAQNILKLAWTKPSLRDAEGLVMPVSQASR
jgi:hypothetical protein